MMHRKGQGISINMVILAAIALLVLVIAVVIVVRSGKTIDQGTGTKSCLAAGGTCKLGTACMPPDESIGVMNCDAVNGETCCKYRFET